VNCDLVSLDAWHILSMYRIWNLLLFLKCNEYTLWIIYFISVSWELCINLNMKNWEVICIQLLENLRIAIRILIDGRSIPTLKLSKVDCSILINQCFEHECLCYIDCWTQCRLSFELKSQSITCPLHVSNVIKWHQQLLAIALELCWASHIFFLIGSSWIKLDYG